MELVKHSATVTRAGDIPVPVARLPRGAHEVDGAGVVTLVSAGVAGGAEPPVGDGAADEVVGSGLLVGDALSVGDGLLVGDGLSVDDGLLVGALLPVADGAAAGEPADGAGAVVAGTGTGRVVFAAAAGNSAATGSVAGVCLATAGDGVGAGVAACGATAWICGPSRPDWLTAALLASAPARPAELADPAR
jgi:hypothetical protein